MAHLLCQAHPLDNKEAPQLEIQALAKGQLSLIHPLREGEGCYLIHRFYSKEAAKQRGIVLSYLKIHPLSPDNPLSFSLRQLYLSGSIILTIASCKHSISRAITFVNS